VRSRRAEIEQLESELLDKQNLVRQRLEQLA
jgi:hypothetical protein